MSKVNFTPATPDVEAAVSEENISDATAISIEADGEEEHEEYAAEELEEQESEDQVEQDAYAEQLASKRGLTNISNPAMDAILEDNPQLTKAQKEVLKKISARVKRKRKNPAPPTPELRIHDIIKVKREWFRPMGLFVIWALLTGQYLLDRVVPAKPKLTSIMPNITKMIPVPHMGESITFTIAGPFRDDGELVYSGVEDEAKFLYLQVVRTFYDANNEPLITVEVAPLWREYLDMREKNLEMVKPLERYVILDLWTNISKDAQTEMFLRAYSDIGDDIVTFKYNYDWFPVPTKKGLIFAFLTLLLLYVLFIFELADPTVSSMICSTFAVAILSILNPRPTFDEMVSWIDMPMLTLLFSLMIIVAVISDAGMFDYLALGAYQLSKGHTWRLILNLCIFISLLSAFLNNSTTMLLSSPIIIKLCEVSGINPVSVLTQLVICANIGAACTPIGSPPNIIITSNEYIANNGVHFGNFMLHMAPCAILVLLQTYWQLHFYFKHLNFLRYREDAASRKEGLERGIERWTRASSGVGSLLEEDRKIRGALARAAEEFRAALKGVPENAAADVEPKNKFERTLMDLRARHGRIDKPLLIKCFIVLLFIITVYMLRSFEIEVIGFTWTALLGSILLLIWADVDDFEGLLCRIEWSTIIFLASYFVLIEVLSKLGLEELLGHMVVDAIQYVAEEYQLLVALMLILWTAGLASCFLNNNPVTQMMLRIVISIAQSRDMHLPLQPLVWALVLGAAFGGNGSLIGASSNIVTAGVAAKHCYKLTFRTYFLVGFSIMLVNLLLASLYLILMFVVIKWDVK
ncbi:P protein-like [Eurosta solidaginis]|uniref:P protein-like n=1 Tax=Eurosta solidaginis TaxID=178769 RepID=UPI003530DF2A